MSQIDISVKLHSIKKVVLTNHEDCGAYGAEGTEEKHRQDLLSAAIPPKFSPGRNHFLLKPNGDNNSHPTGKCFCEKSHFGITNLP